MSKPKGGKTQTTTQNSSTTYPQWTQDALQGLAGAGAAMNSPFIQTPNYGVAGFNPDQLMAFDLARQGAMSAFTGAPTSAGEGGNVSGRLPQMAAAQLGNPALIGATPRVNAAQTDGSAIQALMNPYLDSVVNPAIRRAERSRDENQAEIGRRAAASGSFGGSREAIQRGQADRAYQEGTSELVGQLMAQGYDRASALAQANTQLRQQTGLSNAEMALRGMLSDQSARNQFALTQSGYDQQAGMSNFDAALRGLFTDQATGLERARMNDAFRTSAQARQQSALQQLLGIGNQQQTFSQGVLGLPFESLQRVAGLTPQVLNSSQTGQTTAPNNSPSPLQTILGTGLSLFGGRLSDKDAKTNVEKLGDDPATGLPLYAYDYKDDVKRAKKGGAAMPPKRVGPMAQDIERVAPGSTKRVGGRLAVMLG